jgi:hypothetical protein
LISVFLVFKALTCVIKEVCSSRGVDPQTTFEYTTAISLRLSLVMAHLAYKSKSAVVHDLVNFI